MSNESSLILPFQPWEKYPSLARERLVIVANLLRDVRHDAVIEHQPDRGDTNWGLGCKVYERTCFKLRTTAPQYPDWLVILPETKGLQFSFAIRTVPFRFYRGSPDDPPDRYNIRTFGELHHLQMCLELDGLRPLDNILRLAVETHPSTLEATTISVVETDEAGNPVSMYSVPLQQTKVTPITVMQAKPIELGPPAIEPLTKIEDVAAEEYGTEQSKKPKTDTGSN